MTVFMIAALSLTACSGSGVMRGADRDQHLDADAIDSQPDRASAQDPTQEAPKWPEFFRNTRVHRELEFPRDARENPMTWGHAPSEDGDSLDSIQRGQAEGAGSSSSSGGGVTMSYDPELRRMGFKVGRDGNLHRVGGDTRDARDPDEGPAVDWGELHRKQFGH